MQRGRLLLALFLVLAVAIWVADSVIAALFFYDAPFLDLLFLRVPQHELYTRVAAGLLVLLFGLWVVRLDERRRQHSERLEHINRVLDALRQINQLLSREKERDRLLQAICDAMAQTRGYRAAWLALVDGEERAERVFQAGWGAVFAPLREALQRGEWPRCAQEVLHRPQPVVFSGPIALCTDCALLRSQCEGQAMAVRLAYEGKTYGMLAVALDGTWPVDDHERALFAEVADDIAFCLHDREREERQRQLDKALRRERDFSASLVEASPTFFVAIGADDGRVRWMNPAMLQALGYTHDEVQGLPYLETFVPQEDRPALAEIFRQLSRPGQKTRNLNHVLTKDGRALLVEWHGVPVMGATGEVEYFFGVGLDVTERQRAEEERERMIAELKQALAEVKTLSGLLPICASCKKIRTDEGYWVQLEKYISEHSAATFTHGICPECAKKLYAEFYNESDEGQT